MKSPGPEFKKFSQTLKKIILDSWFPERGNNPDYTPAEKRKKIHNLQARVRRLISNTPDEEHCRRFAKRLRREITHLFTFIRLGTECTNNVSERSLRPSVAARDLSLGSKTYAGAYKHAVLFSIRETCRMRGANPHDFLIRYMRNEIDDIPKAAAVPAAA